MQEREFALGDLNQNSAPSEFRLRLLVGGASSFVFLLFLALTIWQIHSGTPEMVKQNEVLRWDNQVQRELHPGSPPAKFR